MTVPLNRLITSSTPIDKQARQVAFSSGEHFQARFNHERKKQRITMLAPPRKPVRPRGAEDYTGWRNGKLTAMFWFRSAKKKGSVWVVRCDCGYYEFRKKVGRWPENPCGDMCELCEREKEMLRPGKSRDIQEDRKRQWSAKLRMKGLTNEDIAVIEAGNINTKERDVKDIKRDIALTKEASNGLL